MTLLLRVTVLQHLQHPSCQARVGLPRSFKDPCEFARLHGVQVSVSSALGAPDPAWDFSAVGKLDTLLRTLFEFRGAG